MVTVFVTTMKSTVAWTRLPVTMTPPPRRILLLLCQAAIYLVNADVMERRPRTDPKEIVIVTATKRIYWVNAVEDARPMTMTMGFAMRTKFQGA